MRKISTLLLTTLCLLCSSVIKADTYPKQEFRAVWMGTVWNLDWPTQKGTSSSIQAAQKEEMTKYLDILAKDGFNAVFFQVRSMCDAMYKSSYEPWSSYLTGNRGTNPGWDPLSFVVSECHKRGMECHAWVNPYRFTTSTIWTTSNDNAMKNNGWLLTYGSNVILNPGHSSARWRIVNVCKEIVNNYDIDGLVFDDYFYPEGIPEDSNAGDYNLWKSSNTSLSFGDWRRSNVNLMIKNVHDAINESKPWVRFGVGPAGAACSDPAVAAKHGVEPLSNYCSAKDWQYNSIYSDPVQWLKAGTIDYITPQIYWLTTNSDNPFGPITQWWSVVANQFGRHHFASHSTTFLQNSNTQANWEEVGKQAQYSRDYTLNNAPGEVYYSAREITGKKVSGFGDWLKSNKYQNKAVPPAMTWYNVSNPGRISSLTRSGNTLNCTAMNGMRYIFYAIPNTTSRQAAKSTTSNGLKSEYIVGISYSNSYTLTEKTSGYWYAVAPYDRYGNEWDITTLNEVIFDPAPASEAVSPINGSVHKPKYINFSFTKADVDAYQLVISKDVQMKNKVFDQTITPTISVDGNNTYNLNAYGYEDGTYYWKIVTRKEGFNDTDSEIRYFEIQAISEPCQATEIIAPKDGKVISLGEVKLNFKRTDADSYKLQIAKDSEFNNIVFQSSNPPKNDTDGSLYYSGGVALFPNGNYYWRIVTSKAEYFDNYSEPANFVINRPQYQAPELISPADNAVFDDDNVTFIANDVNADSYKLEVAFDAEFTKVLYSSENYGKNGSEIVFSTKEIGLRDGVLHYWRVSASKDGGYTDGISETRILTVVLPAAPVSQVFYPENDAVFDNEDVVICASNPKNASNTKLEIATDESFSNIVYSTYDYTVIDNLGAPQYIIPASKLSSGKYFFRMVTSAIGLKDSYSEVRSFYVTFEDQTGDSKVDNTDYSIILSNNGGYYKFRNLWIRSQNTGNDIVPTGSTTQTNRDMDVMNIDGDGNGDILITYSSSNSPNATINVLKFNAATGQLSETKSIYFPSDYTAQCSYSPLNNIMVDKSNNILVANLVVSNTKRLALGKYNPSNGFVSTVKIFDATATVKERIDHTHFYGSLNYGNSYLFATTNANKIYRHKFVNGTYNSTESMTLSNSLGTAPRLVAVDENHFFVDGSSTAPAYYQWGNENAIATMDNANSIKPTDYQMNGIGYIEFNGEKFLIYPYQGYKADYPVSYKLVRGAGLPSSFTDSKTMWDFPEAGLGKITPAGGDYGALVRIAQPERNTAFIYTFAPNNGLAAYRLDYVQITGVDNIADDYRPELYNGELLFGGNVDNLQIFNASGILVADENNVSQYPLPEVHGMYIVIIRKGSKTMTYKFIK